VKVPKWAARSAVALLVLPLLAGCSGNREVGKGLKTEGFNASGGSRLGDPAATTTAPPATAAPATTPASAAPKATTPTTKPAAKPTPTVATAPPPTQPAQQIAIEIKIHGDNAGTSQFDPSLARIYSGTCAKFTNADAVARSADADGGAFITGSIQPGASSVVCPKQAGKFNYHDGTRPYAVASLEVISR
jgi:plastocyanin